MKQTAMKQFFLITLILFASCNQKSMRFHGIRTVMLESALEATAEDLHEMARLMKNHRHLSQSAELKRMAERLEEMVGEVR